MTHEPCFHSSTLCPQPSGINKIISLSGQTTTSLINLHVRVCHRKTRGRIVKTSNQTSDLPVTCAPHVTHINLASHVPLTHSIRHPRLDMLQYARRVCTCLLWKIYLLYTILYMYV